MSALTMHDAQSHLQTVMADLQANVGKITRVGIILLKCAAKLSIIVLINSNG